MKKLPFVLCIGLSLFFTKVSFADNYQIFRDIARPNNWSDSMHRWSRGDGAWNNWQDWGTNNQNPWDGATNMMADMTAEAMGDAVSEIEFEFWVEANFDADVWYDMDFFTQNDIYNFWRNQTNYEQNNNSYYDRHLKYDHYLDYQH